MLAGHMVLQILGSLAGLAVGAAAALYAAGPPLHQGVVEPLAITTNSIPMDLKNPARERIGRLVYRGGLELRSRDRRFGGISALLWEEACGRILAATDTGAWIALEPSEEADRLTGITAAWIAPIRDERGRPAASKAQADAEALARKEDTVFVWFEQDHRVQRYEGLSACAPESLAAAASDVSRPQAMRGWPRNGGAEAVSLVGRDLLVLAEQAQAGDGTMDAFLWSPTTGTERPLAHRPPSGFQATGMDAVPGSDRQLILYRRFTPLEGVSAIVAELRPDTSPIPGTVLEVTEIARFMPPLAVDNMEGIAVRHDGDRLFLYLASDDNFNPLQRTLLLKFELLP
ncbi:MAG: esterase-like activity of phytase family protein [Thermaurantiacus sp.]